MSSDNMTVGSEFQEFQQQIQMLQKENDLFRTENEQMKALTKEQREKIRSLKNQVFKYQTTYHDIDIGELHRKLQYFESECDVLSRLTTRQAQHLEHMKLNNEKMRAKLKLFKDRERRDQEAAEAALREAQDMADAAASGAGIKQVNKVKPRRSNMNLLGGKGAGVGAGNSFCGSSGCIQDVSVEGGRRVL
jgi:hypothetical protein